MGLDVPQNGDDIVNIIRESDNFLEHKVADILSEMFPQGRDWSNADERALPQRRAKAKQEFEGEKETYENMPFSKGTYTDISSKDGNTAQDDGRNYIDGMEKKTENNESRKVYQSRYPKGTPSHAKSKRVLELIRDMWAKKPIPLNILNPDGSIARQIEAQFDPTYDKNAKTDASKLAFGNRQGTNKDQRVTLDISESWYEITEGAIYNYSKNETGKNTATHNGVKKWHYFINDILFQEHGETETTPYRVSINVKERDDGNFIIAYQQRK